MCDLIMLVGFSDFAPFRCAKYLGSVKFLIRILSVLQDFIHCAFESDSVHVQMKLKSYTLIIYMYKNDPFFSILVLFGPVVPNVNREMFSF